jgi:phospholipase/lecithinase/hemolysin
MLHRSALFLLSLPAFSQIPFTHFVVFGDSLSDNGNLYYGTSEIGLPTPGPPSYATGEYTDGTNSVPPTTGPLGLWLEQLAPKLSLPVPLPFANPKNGTNGTNYAVAGALTGKNPAFSPTSISAIPGLTDQLNLFLATNPTPAVNALYVFWGGGNDIFGGDSPTTAASNVQGNINTLATLGAKYFLWANLPLVGEVPAHINTANRLPFDQAAMAYNQAQTAAIAQLKTAHPGITIVVVDTYSLFLSIGQNTSTYGFVNITSSAQGMTSVNPNTYLFWDTLHPTTAGHGYVADIAYSSSRGLRRAWLLL